MVQSTPETAKITDACMDLRRHINFEIQERVEATPQTDIKTRLPPVNRVVPYSPSRPINTTPKGSNVRVFPSDCKSSSPLRKRRLSNQSEALPFLPDI